MGAQKVMCSQASKVCKLCDKQADGMSIKFSGRHLICNRCRNTKDVERNRKKREINPDRVPTQEQFHAIEVDNLRHSLIEAAKRFATLEASMGLQSRDTYIEHTNLLPARMAQNTQASLLDALVCIAQRNTQTYAKPLDHLHTHMTHDDTELVAKYPEIRGSKFANNPMCETETSHVMRMGDKLPVVVIPDDSSEGVGFGVFPRDSERAKQYQMMQNAETTIHSLSCHETNTHDKHHVSELNLGEQTQMPSKTQISKQDNQYNPAHDNITQNSQSTQTDAIGCTNCSMLETRLELVRSIEADRFSEFIRLKRQASETNELRVSLEVLKAEYHQLEVEISYRDTTIAELRKRCSAASSSVQECETSQIVSLPLDREHNRGISTSDIEYKQLCTSGGDMVPKHATSFAEHTQASDMLEMMPDKYIARVESYKKLEQAFMHHFPRTSSGDPILDHSKFCSTFMDDMPYETNMRNFLTVCLNRMKLLDE